MNRGQTPLHAALVANYAARHSGTATRGFPSALRRFVLASRLVEFFDGERDLLDQLFPLGFSPDAYRLEVDDGDRRVILVEAEVTSRVRASKWVAIENLFWILDAEPIDLRLHLVERTGAVLSVDVSAVAVALCGPEQQRAKALATITEQPPGKHIWIPGRGAVADDGDWPDHVAATVQRANAEGRMPSLREEAA